MTPFELVFGFANDYHVAGADSSLVRVRRGITEHRTRAILATACALGMGCSYVNDRQLGFVMGNAFRHVVARVGSLALGARMDRAIRLLRIRHPGEANGRDG
jgi:hypothetical protein